MWRAHCVSLGFCFKLMFGLFPSTLLKPVDCFYYQIFPVTICTQQAKYCLFPVKTWNIPGAFLLHVLHVSDFSPKHLSLYLLWWHSASSSRIFFKPLCFVTRSSLAASPFALSSWHLNHDFYSSLVPLTVSNSQAFYLLQRILEGLQFCSYGSSEHFTVLIFGSG